MTLQRVATSSTAREVKQVKVRGTGNAALTLVRGGGPAQMLKCALYSDLEAVCDCDFAIANIADSPEYQSDIEWEGGIEILIEVGKSDDARIQKDTSRALCCLAFSKELKETIIAKNGLQTLFKLAMSLDVAS